MRIPRTQGLPPHCCGSTVDAFSELVHVVGIPTAIRCHVIAESCEHVPMKKAALLLLLICLPAFAADEFTLYELLPPETHQFAITYDVTQYREGAELFFNPIRPGSIATKERVIARADGKDLQFEVVSGKGAKT